ncbi:MBOAT family protein [Rhodovastum atsumiense]|uniref:Probable alginate O-acetylase AlgI n=1 Tax=Rhodovastum atsumiense TaxID=504468 RepID=A0A5M6IXM6_9PROT|nr:MBOAT family O-acyltransferase [Rhodovastum atsumiense]KAA5613042.1 MBOAT family protein [Rhodovastum atsumiense]CAH2600101.1 MBOAT family protein [Rhodovastum atsumiense]
MLFSEPLFLFVFLPSFYAVYLLLNRRQGGRIGFVLLASFAFYAWSDPFFPFLVLASAGLDHLLARAIARRGGGRLLLTVGVLQNLGILVWFKYANFLVDNLDQVLTATGLPLVEIARVALPVGVSFVVFEKITYLVDVHRGLTPPAGSFVRYLFYVFFFPKLLAGPIIKYHDIAGQIDALPRPGWDDFAAGFLRFMLGVAKKTLIADTLARGADMMFGEPGAAPGFSNAWWGVLFFTFQIYFDFSAYSDMAIGLARMLGVRLAENFNMPYIAASMTEFWHRWHISLTSWIREYLYIPLGGNRVTPSRRYANLWICFLASGLWHGAAWNFVAWGAYNGAFLVLDRLFLLRLLGRLPPVVANLITFGIVMVGWVLFRATSLAQAGDILAAMANPWAAETRLGIMPTGDVLAATLAAALICAAPRLPGFARLRDLAVTAPRLGLAVQTGLAVLFICAVGKAVADPFTPFLYFRF